MKLLAPSPPWLQQVWALETSNPLTHAQCAAHHSSLLLGHFQCPASVPCPFPRSRPCQHHRTCFYPSQEYNPEKKSELGVFEHLISLKLNQMNVTCEKLGERMFGLAVSLWTQMINKCTTGPHGSSLPRRPSHSCCLLLPFPCPAALCLTSFRNDNQASFLIFLLLNLHNYMHPNMTFVFLLLKWRESPLIRGWLIIYSHLNS